MSVDVCAAVPRTLGDFVVFRTCLPLSRFRETVTLKLRQKDRGRLRRIEIETYS